MIAEYTTQNALAPLHTQLTQAVAGIRVCLEAYMLGNLTARPSPYLADAMSYRMTPHDEGMNAP